MKTIKIITDRYPFFRCQELKLGTIVKMTTQEAHIFIKNGFGKEVVLDVDKNSKENS